MSYDRSCESYEVALTTAENTSPIICYGGVRAGAVYVPNGSSVTTLTFWGSHDGVTFEAAYTNAGTPAAITLTVAADRATRLPELQGFKYIKAVSNAAGTVNFTLQY